MDENYKPKKPIIEIFEERTQRMKKMQNEKQK